MYKIIWCQFTFIWFIARISTLQDIVCGFYLLARTHSEARSWSNNFTSFSGVSRDFIAREFFHLDKVPGYISEISTNIPCLLCQNLKHPDKQSESRHAIISLDNSYSDNKKDTDIKNLQNNFCTRLPEVLLEISLPSKFLLRFIELLYLIQLVFYSVILEDFEFWYEYFYSSRIDLDRVFLRDFSSLENLPHTLPEEINHQEKSARNIRKAYTFASLWNTSVKI